MSETRNYYEDLNKELREAIKLIVSNPSIMEADDRVRADALNKSMKTFIEKAVEYHLADIKAHENELKENIRRELVAGFLVHPDSLSEDLVQVVLHHLEYRAKKQGWVKE